VVSGVVDAGVIYNTEAFGAGSKVKIVATSDPSWHETIAYPIAALTESKHQALSTAFCDYVAGPTGQQILRSYGFLQARTCRSLTSHRKQGEGAAMTRRPPRCLFWRSERQVVVSTLFPLRLSLQVATALPWSLCS